MPTAMNRKSVEGFQVWLQRHGAEILLLSLGNEWEVLRFRCAIGTGVVYRNQQGRYTPNAEWVNEAFSHFKRGKAWVGFANKPRRRHKPRQKDHLLRRDGNRCFYCGRYFHPDNLTKEHVLSVNHGGPTRIENMVLACEPCNQLAHHLPIIEKIALRDRLIAERMENNDA